MSHCSDRRRRSGHLFRNQNSFSCSQLSSVNNELSRDERIKRFVLYGPRTWSIQKKTKALNLQLFDDEYSNSKNSQSQMRIKHHGPNEAKNKQTEKIPNGTKLEIFFFYFRILKISAARAPRHKRKRKQT